MSQYHELVHKFSHDNKNYKLFKATESDNFVLKAQGEDGLYDGILASGHFRLMIVFLYKSVFKRKKDT
jgi:hypothetical protein